MPNRREETKSENERSKSSTPNEEGSEDNKTEEERLAMEEKHNLYPKRVKIAIVIFSNYPSLLYWIISMTS